MKTKRNAVLNRSAWLGVMAMVASLHMGDRASAQANSRPPERMTYQGFIAGTDGVGLGNTSPKNYDVIFRIYDGESSNSPLWGEQQTVTVDKGYFSVLLGEGAAVPGTPNAGITLSSLFNSATASDRYVGFTVKGIGTGGADVEILPRMRFMTSPYAFLANRAVSATKIIQDNAAGTDLLTASGNNMTLNGSMTLNGKVSIVGSNVLEFGAGIPGKEVSAGQIAYGAHSNGEFLDIIGAGPTSDVRKIKFHTEGGAHFQGLILAHNGISAGGNITSAGSIGANGNISSGGAMSAQSMSLAGNLDVASVTLRNTLAVGQTEIRQDGGVHGIVMGVGRPKGYELNGSILYGGAGPGGADTMLIQGGGQVTSERTVTMYADGGFYCYGPLTMPYGTGGMIRLGHDANKTVHNGKIGYGIFTADAVDFVGGGTTDTNRKIIFHSNSSMFTGSIGIGASPTAPLYIGVGGASSDSAFFTGRLTCNNVYQYSDRRIKDVVGVSPASEDLDAIRQVRVTDYQLKERESDDSRRYKGVIAQELQKVIPGAVTVCSSIIPNILQDATAIEAGRDGKPVIVRMASAHGMQQGDRVRVSLDGAIQEVVVSSVPDDKSFTFPGGPDAPKHVRVIGREVKDFLSVDYQHVYMTAVSALQEVDRRLQAVDQRVQEVEKREARMADLERKAARVENLERDVAELRKLMAAIQSGAGKGATSASADGSSSGAVASSR